MATLALESRIDAPADLVYRIVADVERYPEFLPDVSRAERRDDVVSMTLRMGLIPVTLVTRARFTPPAAIELVQIEGPFRRFDARWTFAPDGGGTLVGYRADYELPLLGALFAGPTGFLLERATRSQIRAFEGRVQALLDSPSSTG